MSIRGCVLSDGTLETLHTGLAPVATKVVDGHPALGWMKFMQTT